MSTGERPRFPAPLFLTVLAGLAAGAAAGGGVGVGLYRPAIGITLALAAGAITGVAVWRTRRARPRKE